MNVIHLEIQVGNSYEKVYLDDDASIELEICSQLWNDSSTFSQPFEIPIEANRHILGNVDNVRGHSIYKLLYGKKFRLWVEGFMLQTGIIKLDNEVEIEDGKVEIELSGARKEFEEMLEGVNAQDVPIFNEDSSEEYSVDTPSGNVMVGYSLPETVNIDEHIRVYNQSTKKTDLIKISPIVYNPRIVFPYIQKPNGEKESYVNTALPYPSAAYCNVDVCYKKMDMANGSWSAATRGYNIGASDRIHSSPCFYVLYWIDRLFACLNIGFPSGDNALLSEPGMNYLAFANAKCKYKNRDKGKTYITAFTINYYPNFSCVCNTKALSVKSIYPQQNFKFYGSDTEFEKGIWYDISISAQGMNTTLYPILQAAYATGENFPDTDAMNIIEAIENGFGCRFIFDSNGRRAKVVFFKDVLSSSSVTDVDCVVESVSKQENHINGFRLKYSASTNNKKNELTKKDKEYTGETDSGEDTTYQYNDYRDVKAVNDPDDTLLYGEVISSVGATDRSAYYNMANGDLYRVKVDADAKSAATLYPSLFEVAGHHDVEIGDCSEDDFVHEVSIGFSPLISNDTNYENEVNTFNGNSTNVDKPTDKLKATYATLLDVEIHHLIDKDNKSRIVDEAVVYDTPIATFYAYPNKEARQKKDTGSICKQTLSLPFELHVKALDTWDMSSGIDHPFDGVDLGFTLGFLRSSNLADGVHFYAPNYDGEGWGIEKAEYVTAYGNGMLTADSVDPYGNVLDNILGDNDLDGMVSANEVQVGTSLKLQAEKKNPYWKQSMATDNDEFATCKYASFTEQATGCFKINKDDDKINRGHRGLYDRYYQEYAYWVINRRIAVFHIKRGGIGMLQLIGMDMTKKYRINGYSGFINRINMSIDSRGLGDVTIEMYYV